MNGQAALGWCRDHVVDPLLATVFPPRCCGCGRFETYLCPDCRRGLVAIEGPVCRRCGQPGVPPGAPGWCAACVGQEPTFRSARSAFVYEGPAKRLVSCFKYDGLRVLGRLLAESAAPEFERLLGADGRRIVTWVPAHASVVRSRGYNQAEVFARCLTECLGSPEPVSVVTKSRRTDHQRGLDRDARALNLRGAFAAREDVGGRDRVSGRSDEAEGVVLVDDVFTTGATVAEVSRVLIASTGLPVDVFTFARTPADFPQRHD